MKTEQLLVTSDGHIAKTAGTLEGLRPQFALVFGGRHLLERPDIFATLQRHYPGTRLLMASTAGEVADTRVTDDHIVVTAVALERTRVTCAAISVRTQFESYEAGRELAQRLKSYGLVHVLVLADGQLVNGTELARGFNEHLPSGVILTGGLAGDGLRFERTVAGLDEVPTAGRIIALGFYGHRLKTGFGSSGGWSPRGEERAVTASAGNILLKLDGQPALDLYQEYIGRNETAALPASGLRFPLWVMPPGLGQPVVRSVLAVDESTRAMMFAGDIPAGSRIKFMEASREDLIAGAAKAASQAAFPESRLVICISCVGRRAVLDDRTSEELRQVRTVSGESPMLTGFYSYGELAPVEIATGCQLHNQTMTITTIGET